MVTAVFKCQGEPEGVFLSYCFQKKPLPFPHNQRAVSHFCLTDMQTIRNLDRWPGTLVTRNRKCKKIMIIHENDADAVLQKTINQYCILRRETESLLTVESSLNSGTRLPLLRLCHWFLKEEISLLSSSLGQLH